MDAVQEREGLEKEAGNPSIIHSFRAGADASSSVSNATPRKTTGAATL
jgi:hypothetical protein